MFDVRPALHAATISGCFLTVYQYTHPEDDVLFIVNPMGTVTQPMSSYFVFESTNTADSGAF